jgi:hypothetical protein
MSHIRKRLCKICSPSPEPTQTKIFDFLAFVGLVFLLIAGGTIFGMRNFNRLSGPLIQAAYNSGKKFKSVEKLFLKNPTSPKEIRLKP